MIVRFAKLFFSILLLVAVSGTVCGQTSDSQNFRVAVPTSATVTVPSDQPFLVHDETDADQEFEPQYWIVRGSSESGMNATFSTAQPFVNSLDGSQRRDVELRLAIDSSQGPAVWSIDVPSDRTDIATDDQVAAVSVSSDNVGMARLSLTVTFITGGFGTFSEGDYTTTVVGTVSAN